MIHSEFGRRGLADDERAGPVQHADGIRVFRRPATTQASAAVFGWHVAGVEHILHTNWQTMQRAERQTRGLPFICHPRAFSRQVGVQEAPGLHLRFASGNPLQAGLHHRCRC
jgi:hypothetical protein